MGRNQPGEYNSKITNLPEGHPDKPKTGRGSGKPTPSFRPEDENSPSNFEELQVKPLKRPFTKEKQEQFLVLYSAFGVISRCASMIGVTYSMVDQARKKDKEFLKLFNRAKEIAADTVEAEVFERAVTGWKEPVFYKGEIVGEITKKSDRMLELLAKAVRPEKFSEKFQLSGKGGGPIQFEIVNFAKASKEELDSMEEADTGKIIDVDYEEKEDYNG